MESAFYLSYYTLNRISVCCLSIFFSLTTNLILFLTFVVDDTIFFYDFRGLFLKVAVKQNDLDKFTSI